MRSISPKGRTLPRASSHLRCVESFGEVSGVGIGRFRDLFHRKTELSTSASCSPKDPIPEGVLAELDEIKSDLDNIYVAWEAEWVAAPDGDPLLIGEIDGVYFLVGKWNTTDMESFIAKDFSS